MRTLAWLALLPVASLAGCTCGNKQSTAQPAPTASSSAASAVASASAAPAASATSVFSAPIGGARWSGSDAVAGLVAASSLVRAAGFSGAAAEPAWTSDAMTDVTWAPDSEVRVIPTAGGLALVWHGPRGGKSSRTLLRLDAHGGPLGGPQDVGAAYCVTDGGVAWIEARSSGPSRVLARGWSETDAHPVATIAADRDPALLCADHDVVALGGGDDDLVGDRAHSRRRRRSSRVHPRPRRRLRRRRRARALPLHGGGRPRHRARRLVGRALAAPGAQGRRTDCLEAAEAHHPGRRRRRRGRRGCSSVVIVYTRDADDACPGVASTAESVRALRVDRRPGTRRRSTSPRPPAIATRGRSGSRRTPRAPSSAG